MSTSADTTRVRTADDASTWWTTSTASVPTAGRARPAIPVSYIDSVLMCVYVPSLLRPQLHHVFRWCLHWACSGHTGIILSYGYHGYSCEDWVHVCVWPLVFLCNPGQVKGNVTRPPAVTEAPATTMGMPSAVPAHLVGEETHATQVRDRGVQESSWSMVSLTVLLCGIWSILHPATPKEIHRSSTVFHNVFRKVAS